ncbi:MAG: transposase, partial [Malacoplasma sp.]
MYYVGIDVAKYKHDCYICSSEGVKVFESFSFDNSNDGLKELQSALDYLDHSRQIKICLKVTGIYWRNLKFFLSSVGYDFHEFNTLLMKRFHDSLSNRKTKTGKIDACTIALYLSTGASRTYLYSSYHTEAQKQLSLARNKLIRSRSYQYVIITKALDVKFPEFKQFFNNKLIDTALFLLNKYKTVKPMSHLPHQACVLLHNNSRRVPISTFEEFRDLAKHTIGHHFNY